MPRSQRIAAVVVVAWSMTAQVYAAEGERHFSERIDGQPAAAVRLGRAKRPSGESVVVIGQQISDATTSG